MIRDNSQTPPIRKNGLRLARPEAEKDYELFKQFARKFRNQGNVAYISDAEVAMIYKLAERELGKKIKFLNDLSLGESDRLQAKTRKMATRWMHEQEGAINWGFRAFLISLGETLGIKSTKVIHDPGKHIFFFPLSFVCGFIGCPLWVVVGELAYKLLPHPASLLWIPAAMLAGLQFIYMFWPPPEEIGRTNILGYYLTNDDQEIRRELSEVPSPRKRGGN